MKRNPEGRDTSIIILLYQQSNSEYKVFSAYISFAFPEAKAIKPLVVKKRQ